MKSPVDSAPTVPSFHADREVVSGRDVDRDWQTMSPAAQMNEPMQQCCICFFNKDPGAG